MIRKIATLAGAAVLLLGSAAPAFATFRHYYRAPELDLDNDADIDIDVDVSADTGDNDQDVRGAGYNFMKTGDATAVASIYTFANIFDPCGCRGLGDLDIDNDADVDIDADVSADTGDNDQDVSGGLSLRHRGGHHSYGSTSYNKMFTGDAEAGADVWTVVNADWAYMPSMPE